MKPGDLHWVELPAANGREQSGRRPAILLQDDQYAQSLPLVLAIPLTTALRTQSFPGTLLIQPTAENGLRQPSIALVFQLRAVDRKRVLERIGALNSEDLGQIFALLDRLTGR